MELGSRHSWNFSGICMLPAWLRLLVARSFYLTHYSQYQIRCGLFLESSSKKFFFLINSEKRRGGITLLFCYSSEVNALSDMAGPSMRQVENIASGSELGRQQPCRQCPVPHTQSLPSLSHPPTSIDSVFKLLRKSKYNLDYIWEIIYPLQNQFIMIKRGVWDS